MSTMNCEEARSLLPAYGDGELDLPHALALERHLDGCTACAAALREQRALSQAVRGTPYHRAPDILRARLRAQLPLEPAAPPATATPTPAPVPAAKAYRRRDWSRWAMPIAASIALAIGLNVMLSTQRNGEILRNELVAGHVRSLQAEHLSDVASSDQHTVKPWFSGKLDYSPPVRDLTAQEFPLLGGRLDYIAQRQVAVLIYRHRKHTINLYIWPGKDGDTAPESHASEGYSLVHWRRDGMEFWAVSDLNGEELRQFAQLQIAAVTDKAANVPNT